MSTKKDFYGILNIQKSASPDEIKKSYKKLAMKWHPDKNPGNEKVAEEKFKEIAEAYATLIDPTKRKNYDLYGNAEFVPQSNGRANNFNYGDFSDIGFTPKMGGGRKGFGGSMFDSSFGGFTFERAEEIFREAFGEDFDISPSRSSKSSSKGHKQSGSQKSGFMDNDMDNFFKGGSRIDNIMKNFGMGGMGSGGRRDPFFDDDDDFFGGSMGGFGSFGGFKGMEQMMQQNMRGGMEGTSKSVSTSTIIRNGKKVTVTKTTIRNPDGTTKSEVHEKVEDGSGRMLKDNRYDHSQFSRIGEGIVNGNRTIGQKTRY